MCLCIYTHASKYTTLLKEAKFFFILTNSSGLKVIPYPFFFQLALLHICFCLCVPRDIWIWSLHPEMSLTSVSFINWWWRFCLVSYRKPWRLKSNHRYQKHECVEITQCMVQEPDRNHHYSDYYYDYIIF